MAAPHLSSVSCYAGAEVVFTTKHRKGALIAPIFQKILGAHIIEKNLDTDTLGTFTGETPREQGMLECAKQKCLWGIKETNAKYALASEGSFGPHPFIPFLAINREILYFIDRTKDFHLHLTLVREKTNYAMKTLDNIQDLYIFAKHALFPSHALIVRPNVWVDKGTIFKGIQKYTDLEHAFYKCLKTSPDNKVWIETDMRAHLNPTRRKAISELADKVALRLGQRCPHCTYPGWGIVNVEVGLECRECSSPTDLIRGEVYACVKCEHKETRIYPKGIKYAEPQYCPNCNP
jgi:hypothetical protein